MLLLGQILTLRPDFKGPLIFCSLGASDLWAQSSLPPHMYSEGHPLAAWSSLPPGGPPILASLWSPETL